MKSSEKMRKAAAVCLAALLLSLASCGAETSSSGKTAPVPGKENTPANTQSALDEPETTVPAVTEAETEPEPIKIMPLPITRVGENPDWGADWNQAKVKKEAITEGLVKNGVYVGKTLGEETWMFYQDSIEDFEGTNLYSAAQLKLIGASMQQRADFCKENGMEFYLMLCPNKNVIYPELMPDGMEMGSSRRFDQVINYLKENTTVKVIDVRDSLYAAKEAHPDEVLYYPYDTHWNNHGGFAAYQAAMDVMRKDFPSIVKHERDEYQIDYFKSYFKDQLYYLGWYDTFEEKGPVYTMLNGKIGKCTWTDKSAAWGQFVHAFEDPFSGYSDSTSNAVFENPYAKDAPSIYIVHDSFFIALNSFFRDSFSGMSSHWSTYFGTNDILKYKPDIVLFECVEAMMDSAFGEKPLG